MADLDLIALDVAMVTDNQGHSYTVVKDASSYYDYRKHFSIYVATKVAENDLKLFEQKVVSAWRQKSK